MTDALTETDIELFGALFVLMEQITLAVEHRLEPFGLTSRQWLLLGVLDRAFAGRAPTISEATAVFGTSRQNVKQVALQLERKGWLRLERDLTDRRMLRLALTDRLSVFRDPQVQADQAAFILTVFGGLSSNERRRLLSMVTRCMAGLSSVMAEPSDDEGSSHELASNNDQAPTAPSGKLGGTTRRRHTG